MNQPLPQHNRTKVYVGLDAMEANTNKSHVFELSRTIFINFSKLENYDKFLNKVLEIGVEHISPLSMTVKNGSESYQQALINAIVNAKDKAKVIAKQANISLGGIIYFKELSSNHYLAPTSRGYFSSDYSVAHRSLVTDTAISAHVLVKFAIKE